MNPDFYFLCSVVCELRPSASEVSESIWKQTVETSGSLYVPVRGDHLCPPDNRLKTNSVFHTAL